MDHSPCSCDLPHWTVILLGHGSSVWEMAESVLTRKWKCMSVNEYKRIFNLIQIWDKCIRVVKDYLEK